MRKNLSLDIFIGMKGNYVKCAAPDIIFTQAMRPEDGLAVLCRNVLSK